jgi:hypothetical protein
LALTVVVLSPLDGSEWRFSAMFSLEAVHTCCHPFLSDDLEWASLQGVTLHYALSDVVTRVAVSSVYAAAVGL